MPWGWQHPKGYKLQSFLRPRLRTGLNEGEPHQSGHHVLLLCSCVSRTRLRAWARGGGLCLDCPGRITDRPAHCVALSKPFAHSEPQSAYL